ncbi:ABC transporter ATP-binding protein [Candidatus Sumerlaeota bacterium]|nr:ABC transporter ATP-binding protein [Candidatus Sumerlaeota bacterium]
MERVVFDNVWKMYDRVYGSSRFRRLLATLTGRDPSRNEFWALRDVSFRLAEGQSLGVIGPNGSGKTTILRILSGISYITQGHVRVRGTTSALIALGAGFHPELTGRENVYLNGSILGLKRAEIHGYFDDIVEFADIGDYIDAPVKRYSSGMFVRLGFAVAAQIRPDVLLVDEVLAVGDARFQARCHERIRELREQGAIVILVSHDLWAVRQSCQQGLFIKHGSIREAGPIIDVIDAYNRSIQQESIEKMIHEEGERGEPGTCACDLEFLDAQGEKVSEIPLGQPVTIRLMYDCDEPVRRPCLVVMVAAHHGPCATVLRSRKENWRVDELSGTGHVDLTIDSLRLNPGRYAVQFLIKDEGDMVAHAVSRFRELYVRTPHADWCYENCVYVPDARWSDPAPHDE